MPPLPVLIGIDASYTFGHVRSHEATQAPGTKALRVPVDIDRFVVFEPFHDGGHFFARHDLARC